MRIKTQFTITMLLFGIILVVMAASSIITNRQTEKVSRQEEIASSIAQGATELSYLSNDYLIYRESQQMKRWQSKFAVFSNQVASLRAERPDQQALVANIRANQNRLKEVFDSVASAVGGPSQNRSTTLDPAFLQISWSRMAVQSQGLVSDASRLSQLLHQRIEQLRDTRTILMYVMVGLFGVFLVVSYRLTYRRILKSLARLQAGTAVIGSGNLDFVMKERTNDEIGDLSNAFNRMTANLKDVTASKSELEREIAQREQAEQGLRESEAQLRAIFENLTEGVAVSDLDGRFLYWNRACLGMHGFSSLEECQRRLPDFGGIFELSSADDTVLPVDSWPLSRILRGENLRDLEIRIRRHNTDWQRMFSYGGTLARDMDGKPLLAVVTVADITERKQAEEELRQQREWLGVTLSSIGDAVIASDTEGRITFLNPVAVTLTGWQLEETLGQPIQDVFRIINEKTHRTAEDLVARVLNEKRVVALANDTALVTKDGREVPIEDSAAPIKDSAGNVIGVVLVFHDVTEKRRAQAALIEAHGRSAWLARFPEQNPDPVIRASADGTVLYCNPASAKFHGWTCEVGELLQNELLPLVGRAMAEGKEVQEDVLIAGRFYIVWIAPFPEERYANVYGRDITERKRAEEALQQRTIELQQLTETLEQQVQERTEDLEAANQALRNLSTRLLSAQEEERKRVAGELHDTIGACLSGIKFKVEGSLQQMGKTQNHMTESLKTIIPVIQEGIEDCRRMQQDLRPSMLDDLGLLPTLSWFCRRYQTIYTGIKVELEQTLEEREIPNSLKIVIYRVTQEGMNNIAKHSKADLVRLFLRKMGGRIELILEDNGQGFDLKKVLGSESAKRGLGLTSMRERAELSGGSFAIESAEGKGTTVRASWPI